MAAETAQERTKQDPDDRKIPVFTVLKNGAIVKNIFIISGAPPPSISGQKSIPSLRGVVVENEEISVVGRHPDCNIVLTHPSISRFHLQIHSNPDAQSLAVVDLSSVHGTFVSGKKIEAGVRVELSEGDTLKVGGSSRVYVLHWVPLSQAYELENPLTWASDGSAAEEKEGRKAVVEDDKAAGTYQENKFLSERNSEIQSMDSILEGEDSLSYKCLDLEMTEDVTTVAESVKALSLGDREESSPRSNDEQTEICPGGIESTKSPADEVLILDNEDKQLDEENLSEKSDPLIRAENVTVPLGENNIEAGKKGTPEVLFSLLLQSNGGENELKETCSLVHEPVGNESTKSPADEMLILEDENKQLDEENLSEKSDSMIRVENVTVPFGEDNTEDDEKGTPEFLFSLPPQTNGGESIADEKPYPSLGENFSSAEEEGKPIAIFPEESLARSAEVLEEEKENLPLTDKGVTLEVAEDKSRQNAQYSFIDSEPPETKEHETSQRKSVKSSASSIWSRRGKPSTVLQIQTTKNDGYDERTAFKGKVLDGEIEDRLIPNALFSDLGQEDEEIFTPDKENFDPNNLLLESFRKKGNREVILSMSPISSSSSKLSPRTNREEDWILSSDKENQTPDIPKEQTLVRTASKSVVLKEKEMTSVKRRAARMPFQSLQTNSPGKSRLEMVTKASSRSTNPGHRSQTTQKKGNKNGEKRSWTMVADVSCLLNKNSIKSLKLLQGLKGTHLIIPRMVIRELDSMKRRGSFFKRTTEASSVLEWIEECKLKTTWWIHVQSSMDDGELVAPTPPACSMPFARRQSFMEISSPTTEDHILGTALRFRKMKMDEQLVLLSIDFTMKINAMAEGLLCETAEEFRESLINPFSKRFLWRDSSPRGLTWSCFDDAVLREKYDPCPSKQPPKGLKLVLLHNSHYGR